MRVLWFRRDLRVGDNPALEEALSGDQEAVALFVWDPRLVRPAGAARLAFLAGCLRDLDRSLGGQLVVRSGDPVSVVPAVAAEVGAREVWCATDFGPYGTTRDRAVGDALAARGTTLHSLGSPYAVPPGTLFTGASRPYRVFTPFSRAWRAEGWDDPLGSGPSLVLGEGPVTSDPLPGPPDIDAGLPEPGEAAAHRCLDRFLTDPIAAYPEGQNRPDLAGTSRLSPYLRFGCIHPRQVLTRLDGSDPAHQRFMTELCWREFYADVLFHQPTSARSALRNGWLGSAVDTAPGTEARFDAWASGRTGYPIVDAGMRQLIAEGWMHNRVRMIVASFLVKDLHIDWTAGARWFMRHLVDGDLASNQHNWQWVAGTGTDPSPYFRIFNPVLQGRRFDPEGDYVRRWVPELAGLPRELVHEPWKAAGAALTPAGGYPAPIVDHAAEREETLLRYGELRRSAGP